MTADELKDELVSSYDAVVTNVHLKGPVWDLLAKELLRRLEIRRRGTTTHHEAERESEIGDSKGDDKSN